MRRPADHCCYARVCALAPALDVCGRGAVWAYPPSPSSLLDPKVQLRGKGGSSERRCDAGHSCDERREAAGCWISSPPRRQRLAPQSDCDLRVPKQSVFAKQYRCVPGPQDRVLVALYLRASAPQWLASAPLACYLRRCRRCRSPRRLQLGLTAWTRTLTASSKRQRPSQQ